MKIMRLRAFTLVELMVVMAIIAFLSVGAYGGLTYALRQGRDTQRIRIADQIQTALQAYYADYQGYPGCASATVAIPASLTFVNGVKTCADAFANDPNSFVNKDSSQGGLKDYFESEFKWGPIDGTIGNVDDDLRYYFQPKTSSSNVGNKFTVCVQLENTKGSAAIKNTLGNKSKGCYCVGANQSDVACKNMN